MQLEVWKINQMKLQKCILTKSKPAIYFMPKVMDDKAIKLLTETCALIEGMAKSSNRIFDIFIRKFSILFRFYFAERIANRERETHIEIEMLNKESDSLEALSKEAAAEKAAASGAVAAAAAGGDGNSDGAAKTATDDVTAVGESKEIKMGGGDECELGDDDDEKNNVGVGEDDDLDDNNNNNDNTNVDEDMNSSSTLAQHAAQQQATSGMNASGNGDETSSTVACNEEESKSVSMTLDDASMENQADDVETSLLADKSDRVESANSQPDAAMSGDEDDLEATTNSVEAQ